MSCFYGCFQKSPESGAFSTFGKPLNFTSFKQKYDSYQKRQSPRKEGFAKLLNSGPPAGAAANPVRAPFLQERLLSQEWSPTSPGSDNLPLSPHLEVLVVEVLPSPVPVPTELEKLEGCSFASAANLGPFHPSGISPLHYLKL